MDNEDVDSKLAAQEPPSFSLRLDNGTRIGIEAGRVVKLDFVEGFKRGIVSEDDLVRISEIAGHFDRLRATATGQEAAAQPKRQPKEVPICLTIKLFSTLFSLYVIVRLHPEASAALHMQKCHETRYYFHVYT
jgi:hypothetical protein